VWAGAFDAFSPSRQFLADRVEEIIEIARKGHASMEALLEWGEFVAPSHGIEDDADAVQLKEYELLACSPSAMARDVELRGRIGEGTTPLSDLAPGQQGVTVCGRILELGVRESKKGRNYMYMQFTDGTSVQRGLCFDEELIEKLEEIGSQAGVVLKGHVSDDGDAIFIRQIVRVDSQS
jgi:DNA polymerase III alpha subunit